MEIVNKQKQEKIKRVLLARQIIQSGYFGDEIITDVCSCLGFNDTAFRDQKQKDKLNDFLLDVKYWIKRKGKIIID